MSQIIVIVCLIMIASAICCAMIYSIVKSTIFLAVISALLSILLFVIGCPWAAMFELSVCIGLVVVVCALSVSLTIPQRHEKERVEKHKKNFAVLPFILIFAGGVLLSVLLLSDFDLNVVDTAILSTDFKQVFWTTRQADILGHIIIILAGAMSVVMLFKESDK